MNISKHMKFTALIITLVMIMGVPTQVMAAQPTVNLGKTYDFAVLAGEAITNTGTTTINGEVGGKIGLHPGTSFTGQESMVTSSAIHLANQVALDAKNDLVIAYDDVAGRTPVTTIPTELGGRTLTPGVYASESGTFEITGTLTLDAQGDPDGVFIFQTKTSLTTAGNSEILLKNNARFCRIFWQVGSSATLGVDSHFVGHIFALTSITAKTRATIQGQLLARNGAVTLDSNTITNGLCETMEKPVIPAESAEPVEPVEPSRPSKPSKPSKPVEPVAPVEPEVPETSVIPAMPLEPAKTVIPAMPLEPAKTIIPATPLEPVIPLEEAPKPGQITPVITTVIGGQLPETSTNAYNWLFMGGGFALGGVIMWRRRKRYE